MYFNERLIIFHLDDMRVESYHSIPEEFVISKRKIKLHLVKYRYCQTTVIWKATPNSIVDQPDFLWIIHIEVPDVYFTDEVTEGHIFLLSV